jgi:hypothetical protein
VLATIAQEKSLVARIKSQGKSKLRASKNQLQPKEQNSREGNTKGKKRSATTEYILCEERVVCLKIKKNKSD